MNLKEELNKVKNKLLEKKQQETNNSKEATIEKNEITEERKRMLEDYHTFKEEGTSPAGQKIQNHFRDAKSINLNDKVDTFIDWYFKNMVKGKYSDIGEFHMPYEMRNFIEKMAVWYELRYPDYEINRLMPGSGQELIDINDVMFNRNEYINDLFDENADIRLLEWSEFYSTKAFINSLPWNERYLLDTPEYNSLVYIDQKRSAHLHLTPNGFVQEIEGLGQYTGFKINDKELTGIHIKDVVKILKEKDIELPIDNELEKNIKNVEKQNYQREEMLNCVMYRIIERGGSRIGPRRAFLFAKEFGRNIDIPMMYGVEYSDPGLRKFINEYIKAGGSKELLCYVSYFSRTRKNKMMDVISVKKLLKLIHNDCATKYTPEETELHQRLVNVLASQIDHEEVQKETRCSRLQKVLRPKKKR